MFRFISVPQLIREYLALERLTTTYLHFKSSHAVKRLWYHRIAGRSFDATRTPEMGRAYAEAVEKELKGKNFDLIFSPGTIPIAYLETRIPVAIARINDSRIAFRDPQRSGDSWDVEKGRYATSFS